MKLFSKTMIKKIFNIATWMDMNAITPRGRRFDFFKPYLLDFGAVFENKSMNFEDAYRGLIRGLDIDSVNAINDQLSIIQECWNRFKKNEYKDVPFPFLDEFLTPRELEICHENTKRISRFVKFNDECYAFENYFMPTAFAEESTFIHECGIKTISAKFPLDGDILDVGGSVGDTAMIFRKYVTGKNKVYAFEPMPDNFRLMQKTMDMNGNPENVVPVNCALGDKQSDDARGIFNWGSSHIVDDADAISDSVEFRTFKITTMDNFVQESGIKPALIKVDIEGAEQSFLRGGGGG